MKKSIHPSFRLSVHPSDITYFVCGVVRECVLGARNTKANKIKILALKVW